MSPLDDRRRHRTRPHRRRPDDRRRYATRAGSIDHEELIDELAAQHPYGDWLAVTIDLDNAAEGRRAAPVCRPRRTAAAPSTRPGYTHGRCRASCCSRCWKRARKPSARWATTRRSRCCREQNRPLSHYFRQNFSQVTNPPIDPLREDRVMSLATRFKNLGNILAQDETPGERLCAAEPGADQRHVCAHGATKWAKMSPRSIAPSTRRAVRRSRRGAARRDRPHPRRSRTSGRRQ